MVELRAILETGFSSPPLGEEVVWLDGPESGVVWTCVSDDIDSVDPGIGMIVAAEGNVIVEEVVVVEEDVCVEEVVEEV